MKEEALECKPTQVGLYEPQSFLLQGLFIWKGKKKQEDLFPGHSW